ncbi:MAG: hypothetical protein IJ814_04395 [Paludibacteraceae bacterium]|nr:hypothetical protein [Paludibacteraceae bacterium]
MKTPFHIRLSASIIVCTLCFVAQHGSAHNPTLRLVPTFESCSYYICGVAAGSDGCSVSYVSEGDTCRVDAYTPYFDSSINEWRGSIVRLRANTKYHVRAIIGRDTLSASFTTWTDQPHVGKTLQLSRIGKQKNGAVILDGIHGTPDAWIRIVCDRPVHADASAEAALLIDNCSYLLLDKLTVTGGRLHAVKTGKHASDIRFSNCDISHWGRTPVSQDSIGRYLDEEGRQINNDAGLCIFRSHNIVLERSYIHDPNGKTNTWNGVVELGDYAGKNYVFSHPQGPNAVYVMQAEGGVVIRYNDLVGSQTHRYNDPIEAWQNKDEYGGFAYDADIYGNMIAFGQDDAIELDGGQCNVRMFDNRMEQVYCGVSTAPNRRGPSYIFNNLIWNMGNSLGQTGNAIKNGGGTTYTAGRQYLFHNTIVHAGGGMAGVGYGKDPNRELFVATLRNNIILSLRADNSSERKGYCINDPHENPACDFDYDYLGSVCNLSSRGSVRAYEGAEQHAVYGRPAFTNMQQAVFTLDRRDKHIAKGEYLPGFSSTQHPTAGAFEIGASSLTPQRPVDLEADKYCVTMVDDREYRITVRVGQTGCEKYTIRMAEDMQPWLDVTTGTQRLADNSELTVTLKKKPADVPYWRNGVVFIRLDNGYSIPITVNTPLL